jgi:hypothetical protein
MNLFEDPLPILVGGGLALLLTGLAAWSRRSLGSLVAVAVVLVATVALLLVERWQVTPAEEVQQATAAVLAAVARNDLAGVTRAIDPAAAKVRRDAETLMGLIDVEKCHAASKVEVELTPGASPPSQATARMRGMLTGVLQRGGVRVTYFDKVEIQWVRRESGWKIEGYTAYHRGQAIDAVQETRQR